HNAALLQELLGDFTRPFQKILEIGCRDGHFTQLLRQQYPHADIAVMDCANWLSQDQGKRSFSFQIMDTEVLSFPANTFDLI
ncbi:MAG TPA: class I SAM-dependent methyltransferase, partial [Alphaproteobacteria bacterium]|nr:class I SAM-dependent methyltransferase [Alphaproteobacteria bacterium]